MFENVSWKDGTYSVTMTSVGYRSESHFRIKTIFPGKDQGPVSIWRPSFPGMGIPMLKIRRSQDRLIFNMGIPILVRLHLYIETAPRQSWNSVIGTPILIRQHLCVEMGPPTLWTHKIHHGQFYSVCCEFKVWSVFLVIAVLYTVLCYQDLTV